MGRISSLALCIAVAASSLADTSKPVIKGDSESDRPTLLVFGDSLSDIGSGWTSNGKNISTHPPPWFQGRYSSGFVWNEWAADELDMTLANFAFGGATSDNKFVNATVPSVADQVEMYGKQKSLQRFSSPNDDVVAVEIGSNDIFNRVKELVFADKEKVDEFAKNLTGNIMSSIDKIAGYGYKNFLLFNIPPIQITPMVMKLKLDDLAKPIIERINGAYNTSVSEYKKSNSDITITLINIEYITEMIVDNLLPDLNIKYADKSCVTTSLVGNKDKYCTNPDEFFFMDAIHPTRVPHRLIGYLVAKIIKDNNYIPTVDNMRDIIKEYDVRDVAEAVDVTEYQADGDYADINSQILDQSSLPSVTKSINENGDATPYELLDSDDESRSDDSEDESDDSLDDVDSSKSSDDSGISSVSVSSILVSICAFLAAITSSAFV